jgi:DHA1 family tetracycline resistance protein-like MFS transporter
MVVGRSVKRLGERGTLVLGLAGGGVGFALFGLAPTTLLFMMAIPVDAVFGLVSPAMQALMTESIGPEAQGQLQGALSSMRGVTGMIGPIIFTQIFASSIRSADVRLPGAPFLLAGAFVLAALMTVLISPSRVAARA